MKQLLFRFDKEAANYSNGNGLILQCWVGSDEKRGKFGCLDLRLFSFLY